MKLSRALVEVFRLHGQVEARAASCDRVLGRVPSWRIVPRAVLLASDLRQSCRPRAGTAVGGALDWCCAATAGKLSWLEELIYTIVVASGFAVMWWQHLRRRGKPRQLRAPVVDEQLEIALHVAVHEASTRHQAIQPIHLVYGLLQDEQVVAMARGAGGDVDAIETAVLAELDRVEELAGKTEPTLSVVSSRVLARVSSMATARSRLASCADLLANLIQVDPAAGGVFEVGGVRATDVLFGLVHGVAEKDLPVPARGQVSVVLINDDVTTQEFVVDLLEEHFGHSEPKANALMLDCHHAGRATIGLFSATEASRRARAAAESARSSGFPLMIRLEAADES
jgi:ATP-dependent Clp protease adaptor protein ClpS